MKRLALTNIEMTNEEINKYIHEAIMGKCWHRSRQVGPSACLDCGEKFYATDVWNGFYRKNGQGVADYCSDSSPRFLLNEVVAKLFADDRKEFKDDCIARVYEELEQLQPRYAYVLEATAEQIAGACVEAHKNQ